MEALGKGVELNCGQKGSPGVAGEQKAETGRSHAGSGDSIPGRGDRDAKARGHYLTVHLKKP